MAKKKTTTRARTSRARSKPSEAADQVRERLEESLDVRMQEEDDGAPPPETPAEGSVQGKTASRKRGAAVAKPARGRKKAAPSASAPAEPSPNAVVEKSDAGTVIRFAPARTGRAGSAAVATAAPTAPTPAARTTQPPPPVRESRVEPRPSVQDLPPEDRPVQLPPPRREISRRDSDGRGARPGADQRPGGGPRHRGSPQGRGGMPPGQSGEMDDEVAPPGNRIDDSSGTRGGPDARMNDEGESGEGGRRRRRRRRGGRGRGRGRGPDGQPMPREDRGSAPVATPDMILRSGDLDAPAAPPAPTNRGPQGEERFGPDGLPLPKRRSRRRRRRGGRGRGDGNGGDARTDGGPAMPPPLPAFEAGPERFEPAPDLDDIEPPDFEPATAGADAFDDPEIEELNEARELLAGDEIGEPELEEAADAEEPGAEPARGRGRRGDRRRGRGNQNRRRWRNQGESDEADSRVYGDENAEVIEIDPEAGSDEPAGPPPKKDMIINIAKGEECRIAILENGKLEQIYLERASSENHVGNIYKGVVTNVEASIQAAFVDFGLGKNGFLHISDLHPRYFPNGEDRAENIGRKLPRKARPPIQRCLRRGQEVLVQITKEGIGTKGPTLTTYLSVPGRFLVMMPGSGGLGVSRKIEDEDLRRKLRGLMNQLDLPDDIGFIARTAAENRSVRELQSDLNYLTRLWRAVEKRMQSERAPAEMYRDSDLVIRTIRDVYSSEVQRIVVDDPDVVARAREFLGVFTPTGGEIVQQYADPEPIFHRYGIEAELERLHSRHVPLRSGGSLVIDQTEALVAIDVNSGRFRAEDDAETTAYRINMEAADEIPRQLRLRDLGGVIICDFIDLRQESHRREVEKRLVKNLKQHKERAKVLRMSQFGIIEMTRQRQRASLTRSVYQDCSHCRGSGLIKTAESVALDVMRLVQLAVAKEHIRAVEVIVSSEVAHLLQNRKRAAIYELEVRNRRNISVRPDANFGLDQLVIQYYDSRGRLVPHP